MSDVIGRVWPEWRVEGLLGQGSYGKVYRAMRSSHGHTSYAAIKVIDIPQDPREADDLTSSGMDEASVRSYFEQRARDVLGEVALMETLKGAPNVVSVEDYQLVEQKGSVGWTVLVRMPLLESAKDRLARIGQPDAFEVARLGVDVCKALSSCHAKGVIHRDVKPENIFFGEYGYLLGDFGIARRLGPGAGSAHTRAGAYPYMAPEVFAGRGYGSNVDTYSLGLVLYRYLNGGRMPFLPAEGAFTPADSERAVGLRLAGRALPAPKNADATLASIVLRAADPDPTKRFGSATEMGAALQAWAFGGKAAATAVAGGATVVLDPEETEDGARRASGGATRRTAPTPNAAQAPYGPSGTVRAGSQPAGQQRYARTPTAYASASAPTPKPSIAPGGWTEQGASVNPKGESQGNRTGLVIGVGIATAILLSLIFGLSLRTCGGAAPSGSAPGTDSGTPSPTSSEAGSDGGNVAGSPLGNLLIDNDICTIEVTNMFIDDIGDLRCSTAVTNHTNEVIYIYSSDDPWTINGSNVECTFFTICDDTETHDDNFFIEGNTLPTTNVEEIDSITGTLVVLIGGESGESVFYDVSLSGDAIPSGNIETSSEPTSRQDAEKSAASYDNLSGEYVTTGTVAGGYITSASLTDSEMILIGDLHETTESGAEGPSIGDKTWTFKVDGSSTFGYSADRSFHEQSREEFAETLESLSFVGLKLTIEDGTIVEARMFA